MTAAKTVVQNLNHCASLVFNGNDFCTLIRHLYVVEGSSDHAHSSKEADDDVLCCKECLWHDMPYSCFRHVAEPMR